ncbi:beta-ketoacyl synthase [Pelagibaculum spongiae]|uniref:Beta-ketoacyl synthase n=2 Tax=Pelagibaculum spongiae TaxID=2080658 RepID=A0A2V1H7Y2_9GAMM|nr:beta-ketoacyl synthase [Pelagibaculum spongiae]
MVFQALPDQLKQQTLQSLSVLTGIAVENEDALLDATLVRQISDQPFNPLAQTIHRKFKAKGDSQLIMRKKDLPAEIPSIWKVEEVDEKRVKITFSDKQELFVAEQVAGPVTAAGRLPEGFAPEKLYPSRNHPRGLAMTVYGASDAMHASGLDWSELKNLVPADKWAVYAGSAMAQLDQNGYGGLMTARFKGKRATSKQLPLGLAEMPADFINAYLLGGLGATGTNLGACASFLYNLRQAVNDIRAGRARIAIVGAAEAPVVAEVIEGYATMGALANDKAMRQLDGLADDQAPDHRRACRPFSDNCGFVLAESAQFIVLMDDSLALQTGADILGAVPDVFVHADGYKKSISSPGAGNWLSFAKATALAKQLLGAEGLQKHSMVMAHGTGTPQNRVTESKILNDTAAAFGINDWPVCAVKSYVGHSVAAAAGDQLVTALGVFHQGIIPGIQTIDHIANDVFAEHLHISSKHQQRDDIQAALLNAKGFGGNNATALVLSPTKTKQMLTKRHGEKAMTDWQQANAQIQQKQQQYLDDALKAEIKPIYQFGEGVISDEQVALTDQNITIGSYTVDLQSEHGLEDFL